MSIGTTTTRLTGDVRVRQAQPDLDWTGRIVDGRYRVKEAIGEGGMGRVYQVEHVALKRLAAMKVLHPTIAIDRREARRFRREAQAIARLEHENIIKVFDFGEAFESFYIVTELFPGKDLGAILGRDGALDPSRALRLLLPVCHAIEHAHDLGIIHRDLKPENVLVGRTLRGADQVKVVDFGVADMLDPGADPTLTGEVVGTPAYMAPEQIRGLRPDPRTDVYAMGVMLFALVTGELPFTSSSTTDLVNMHLEQPRQRPTERQPDLDERFDDIVLRAMAIDREQRYPTMAAMRADLEQVLADYSLPVAKGGPRRRSTDLGGKLTVPLLGRADVDRFERRLRRAATVRYIAMALVAALLGGGIWWLDRRASLVGRTLTEEREPNDEFANANPIERGVAITGFLGRRRDLEQSDRDCFVFQIREREPQLVRLTLTGVPEMDLKLEVYDAAGAKLVDQNGRGAGEGETISNLRLGPGLYYVVVRQVWVAGRRPIENLSDPYHLQVAWRRYTAEDEAEPDNVPEMASPLRAGVVVRGSLSSARDVDWYRLDGCANAQVDGPVHLEAHGNRVKVTGSAEGSYTISCKP